MYSKKTSLEILHDILKYYPEAKPELNYSNDFEFLIAVMLSAQTTDANVNKVTKVLFESYKTLKDLKNADISNVRDIVRPLGMYSVKASNVISIAKTIDEKYDGKVPSNREDLIKLPGVGLKTSNVLLATLHGKPYMAVDTHINRVCQRLNIVKTDSLPNETSSKLEQLLKGEDINQYHHSILLFGRYICKAKNPDCEKCNLNQKCKYRKIKIIKC